VRAARVGTRLGGWAAVALFSALRADQGCGLTETFRHVGLSRVYAIFGVSHR